jgi:hypothetical protein
MSQSEPAQVPSDPLIDEVRAIRRAISEQFGNDVDRLCDHLQELQRLHPEWTVEPEPSASVQDNVERMRPVETSRQ